MDVPVLLSAPRPLAEPHSRPHAQEFFEALFHPGSTLAQVSRTR